MRKPLSPLLSLAVLGALVLGLFYSQFVADSRDYSNYKRVQVGMSVDEVQAVLGPGTPVNQAEVPGIVVAMNPADAVAAREKAKRSGGPPPTARSRKLRKIGHFASGW